MRRNTAERYRKKPIQKWYDYGIKYLLYSLVLFIPTVFTTNVFTVFSTPKLMALRLITIAIFILWGCKIFVEESFSYRKSGLNFWLFVYGLISIATTIFSITPFSSLFGTQGRFLGIFTVLNLLLLPFFVWNFLRDKKEIKIILKLSVITASVLAIYGIVQYLGIGQEAFNWNQNPADRVFGTIGHGNHFGAYLGMNLVLGLFLFATLKNKIVRWLWGTGLLIQLTALFLTGSRGALIATILSLIFSGIIVLKRRSKENRISYTGWIVPIFLIISITAASSIIFREDIKKISLVERSFATITNIQEGALPDRFSWWMSSIDMVKDKPILGYGLSTFRDIFNQYRRLDYQTLEPGDMETHITPEAAHNEYLNIAATQGLLGLLSFLAVIIFVFWRIDKTLFSRINKEDFYTIGGIRGALIVYLLQLITSFGVISTLTIFYLLLGAGASMTDTSASDAKLKLKGPAKYLTTVIILLIVGFGSFGAIRETMAEYFYKEGLIEVTSGNIDEAITNFEKMIWAQPYQYAYYQAYGDFAVNSYSLKGIETETKLNLLKSSIKNYQKAIEINSYHPSTYFNMGVAQLQLFAITEENSYYSSAANNFEQSLKMAVNNPLYPYQVGKAYMALKTQEATEKAKIYFEKALEIRNPYRDIETLHPRYRPIPGITSSPVSTDTGDGF